MILGWWTLAEVFPLMRTNLVYSQKQKSGGFGMSRQPLQCSSFFHGFEKYISVNTVLVLALCTCTLWQGSEKRRSRGEEVEKMCEFYSSADLFRRLPGHKLYNSWLHIMIAQEKHSCSKSLSSSGCSESFNSFKFMFSDSQCRACPSLRRIRFWQSQLQVGSAFQRLHCAPDNETGPASVQILKAKCLLSSMDDSSVCVQACACASLEMIRMLLCFQFKIERTESWVQHCFFKGQNTLGADFYFFFFCKPSEQKRKNRNNVLEMQCSPLAK